MGHEDYETVVTLLEEVTHILSEVPELVCTAKPRTALAWLKRARKHLRTASDIIQADLEGRN